MKSAETALARLDGVEKVKVSFMDKKATLTMKPGKQVTEEQAKAAIQKANDEEGNAFELVSFKQVN